MCFPVFTQAQELKTFASLEKNNFSGFKTWSYLSINFKSDFRYQLTPHFLSIADTPKHSHHRNMYGNLTDDDTLYNKKYPLWIPISEIVGTNGLIWALDRYAFNYDYARIGPETWKRNLKEGWEWDSDKFGINFIGHPYSGTLYFTAARSNGYDFWESAPFAVGGSLMWEYFAETTRPSYNDIINTPINGIFLGEIFYRLSENILDDQSRGGERVFREIAAGLISPELAFNRFVQGKMSRVTPREVYQKEPCNISLFAGIQKINTNQEFLTGEMKEMLNIQVDYGNPFEKRERKPFDVFRIRMDMSYNASNKFINQISGYGNLFTNTSSVGKLSLIHGLFQYYDYWDNQTFELGTIGFGEGVISKLNIHKKSNLYTSLHLCLVPFAGSSTHFGLDTLDFRNYNFGGGLEGKFESTFNIGNAATVNFNAYYFWVHTYVGLAGDNLIGVLRPRITVTLIKNLSVGLEEYVYINDRYSPIRNAIHQTRTEQKVFLLLYLENKKRSGHYD